MRVLKRFRYRMYPAAEEIQALVRTFGCARVVFNDVIEARETARMAGLAYPKIGDLSKQLLTQAKDTPERAGLSEVSSVVLQQSLADADRAYRNFFKSIAKQRKGPKMGPPRFKSRNDRRQSARYTRNVFNIRIIGVGRADLFLSRIGSIRMNWSRDLPNDASSVTIIREADGRYYASFVVEVPATPLPEIIRVAGLDLGLTDLAALTYSDGSREKVSNPRFLRTRARALARAQRSLSRKEKGSKNRGKERLKVAVLHRKVRETRLDHDHKLTLRLVRENQTVAVEGIHVKGLARSRLARSIHDASWATLLRLLHEKAQQYDRQIVVIDRFAPTSQACSVCGVKDGPKPLSVRTWTCLACGARLDRDYNAAVNIMVAAGLAETLTACGGDIRLTLASAAPAEAGTHRTDSTHGRAA